MYSIHNNKTSWITLIALSVLGIALSIATITVNGGNASRTNHPHYEFIIFPFYFTIWSNALAGILGIVRLLKIKKENVFKFWVVTEVANMLLTVIVYWGVLFPQKQPATALAWVSNLTVHGITPISMILVGLMYILDKRFKTNIYLSSLYSSFYALGWFAIAIIIYFALGGVKASAIYPFLDFNNKPIIGVVYTLIIAPAYYLLILFLNKLNQPKI